MKCRRLLLCLGVLVLLQPTVSLAVDEQLEVYQTRAEMYYEPGIDENALVEREWNASGDIRPGMYAPGFTLMDLDGNVINLSDYRGQRFVVLEIGNAT